ncbi:type II secretion system inner membrane protein GspF [Geotalea daltonii FRC-32]|uniref:General secretion pathway protein F n=1 Tax=Geotalea daltonii (strain DSM 22248 / JCM 15807 / FRC-32) TaxID=316067 RepID=B9M1W0_GEODF|nr:type II secretion system inner membrane protein GspF [Geotalea daltonii]ACM19256.1 type II secretion system inner membrane protein GspF [Geotalea daltonii FRC-32]
MPTFRYSAFKAGGNEVAGTIEAANVNEVRQRLKKDGLYARQIAPADEVVGGRGPMSFRKKVGLPELSLMTRRLATLLGSSVPVYEAIATLHDQERPGELRTMLGRVRDRLAEGTSLAKALAAEPQIFSDSYIGMVSAGEASGALEVVLERLAEFLEDQNAVRSKIVTSLAYPILMVVVGTGVMLFLLAFVVPKIVTVFEQSKAALPLITVILIKVSSLLRQGWWLLIIIAVAAAFILKRAKGNEAFRRKRDRLMLKLPLAGPLWQRLILSRFAKVLGLLLASGVPVIKAIEITGEAIVNREYRLFLAEASEELIQGGSLSVALRKSPLFPPLMVHMIAVGEKGGELEAMLIKAGNAFEKEFEASITRSMALLEPLLILGMGLCVGTVVLAVLLPIFQLNQLIK